MVVIEEDHASSEHSTDCSSSARAECSRKWETTRSPHQEQTRLLDNPHYQTIHLTRPTTGHQPEQTLERNLIESSSCLVMACEAVTVCNSHQERKQKHGLSIPPPKNKQAEGDDDGGGGDGSRWGRSPRKYLLSSLQLNSLSLIVIFVVVLVSSGASCEVSSSSGASLDDSFSSNLEDSFSPSVHQNQQQQTSPRNSNLYSNHFAVHVPAGEDRANEIANKHGFVNTGQIGSLRNYYLFEHSRIRKRSIEQSHEHHQLLSDEPDVHWFEQQVEKKRVKRDFQYYDGAPHSPSASGTFFGSPSTHSYASPYQTGHGSFPDPLWKEQWYLTGGSKDGFDMNVQVAWKRGYTGKGVTVSILDDGIQTNHPDLVLNYDPRASTDINDNDNDPYPQDNGDNKHGTRCAGEVAATAGNNICGVGVAYNASIGGVRMLDGTVNDAVEAKALGLNPDHVDIFSASWGPEDDGKTVDGPGPLARRAFIYGVTNGRRGLGSIFIWASGNGGRHVDSCNCDGYTNSIFTLSISSATQGGYKPWYLEECSSTLATTYSSGTPTLDKSVATVDMDGRLRPDHICTVEHTGTSASAPLAAGIAALALEANPNLSWRDLQHLVVLTSRPDPLEKEEGWYVNGVQRKFSHKFGYGLMDAGKMVDLAVDWAGVPPQHICKSREIREDREVPGSHLGKVKVFMDVDGCAGTNSEIRYLEHVQCKISLRFFPRGNLRILLTSPMGTTSVLLFERPRDVSSSNFDDWPFLSVHYWGEQAHGRWTLEIINSGSRRINQPGMLKKWQLILYGSDVNPVRLKSRSLSLPHHAPGQQAASQLVPYGQVPDGPQSHPSYRQVGSGEQQPPRFVPQEYLFSSASETKPTHVVMNEKKQERSQCPGQWWVKDLAICVGYCPEGYYEKEEDGGKECLGCGQRCRNCKNETSCSACESNLVLWEERCVVKCPGGWWEGENGCEKCATENCKACTRDSCVECDNGWWLDGGKCVKDCGEGRRGSEATGECVHCPRGCRRCGEGAKCDECVEGWAMGEKEKCMATGEGCAEGLSMKGGECVDSCGEGWYEQQGECFRCGGGCKLCEGEGMCNECGVERGMLLLQGGKCLPSCEDGWFNDKGRCVGCSEGCDTCIGPKDNECVSCGQGRRLTKLGTCAPLQQENSVTQGGGLSSNGTCEDGSFYDSTGHQCRQCHPSCSRCSGAMAFHCRACKYPLRLDRGSSRCIPCCQGDSSEDCCHCDEKRHSGASHYNGECHFVSRRVSESTEREISGAAGLSDRVVLMSFWFTVFVLVLAVILVFQRSKKRKRTGRGGDLSSSISYFNANVTSLGKELGGGDTSALLVGTSSAKGRGSGMGGAGGFGNGVRYTPVNLQDGGEFSEEDEETDEEYFTGTGELISRKKVNQRRLEEEDEEEYEHQRQGEGVPLVLKT